MAALRDVVRRVRDAGSVHLEVGNLNPPPTTYLDQDYADAEGDLELRVEVMPGQPVLVVRRVDGELLVSEDGEGFRAAPPVDSDDTSLVSRVLATTPAAELEALAGAATTVTPAPRLLGDVAGAAAAYRLLVDTADLTPPEVDALASVPWQGLPERLPVTLWVGADGLPLRLEARYADPLNGIEGTGTARIDYSAWGEPVDLPGP